MSWCIESKVHRFAMLVTKFFEIAVSLFCRHLFRLSVGAKIDSYRQFDSCYSHTMNLLPRQIYHLVFALLIAPSVLADVTAMVTPPSKGEASIASSPPAQDDLIVRARALHADAVRSGYFSSMMHFTRNTDPELEGSAAYVVPDFASQSCTLHMSEQAISEAGLTGHLSFRFLVYHESAHCDLYLNPRTMRVLPQVSAKANQLLSDLIQMEYLHPSAPRRINGYNMFHETYADIKAMAVLRSQGSTEADLRFILNFRTRNTTIMDSHDTHTALTRAATAGWNGFDRSALESRVRELAEGALAHSFLKRTFNTELVPFIASDLLKGALRMPLSTLRFAYSSERDRQFIRQRMDEIQSSGNAAWTEFTQLANAGLSESDLLQRFFKDRYGLLPADIALVDAQIADALVRLGG